MARASTTPNAVYNASIITPTASTLSEYGIYNFIDEFGNVTQIKKGKKKRLEFYPERINVPLIEPCVIGVSDPASENCTEGIAMGCGEIGSSTEMAYAIY